MFEKVINCLGEKSIIIFFMMQVVGIRYIGGVLDKVEFLMGVINILFVFGGYGIIMQVILICKLCSSFVGKSWFFYFFNFKFDIILLLSYLM